MFKMLIFGILMFGLGFLYGRDETLWRKTKNFVKKIVKKIKKKMKK